MSKSNFIATLLLGIVAGIATLAPLPAAAAPPCPECYYPWRYCVRNATTPAEQQACDDEYAECLAIFCPNPFLTTLIPSDRSRTIAVSQVERTGMLEATDAKH